MTIRGKVLLLGQVLLASMLPGVSSAGNRPNIVLIVADTVRPDHLSCYGYERLTSPTIDSLAASGVVFENAYTAYPQSIPAHEALLTGVLPGYFNEFVYEPGQTLAGILAKAGYVTVSVSANPLLDPELYSAYSGFDFYRIHTRDSTWVVKRSGGIATFDCFQSTDADSVVNVVRDLLRELRSGGVFERDKRLFLFVNLMDAHEPYDPPPPYDRKFTGGIPSRASGVLLAQARSVDRFIADVLPRLSEADLERLRALYDGEIAYEDHCLQRLLGELAGAGFGDDLGVIVVSDHGEYLGEHGLISHGFGLDEEVIRIPLVVSYPRAVPSGRRERGIVSIVDVAPTILALAGLDRPSYIDGISLLEEIPPGRVSFSFDFGSPERARILGAEFGRRKACARRGKWKYLRGVVRDSLYEVNGLAVHPVVMKGKLAVLGVQLRKQIINVIQRQKEKPLVSRKRTLSGRRLEELRKLGYVE